MVVVSLLIVSRIEPVKRRRRLSGSAALRGRGQLLEDQVVVVDHSLHVLAHAGAAADPDDVVATLHVVQVPGGACGNILGRPMGKVAGGTKNPSCLRSFEDNGE